MLCFTLPSLSSLPSIPAYLSPFPPGFTITSSSLLSLSLFCILSLLSLPPPLLIPLLLSLLLLLLFLSSLLPLLLFTFPPSVPYSSLHLCLPPPPFYSLHPPPPSPILLPSLCHLRQTVLSGVGLIYRLSPLLFTLSIGRVALVPPYINNYTPHKPPPPPTPRCCWPTLPRE